MAESELSIPGRVAWPNTKPTDALPLEGWLGAGNKRMLKQALREEPRAIVELGSWLGLSARFFAENAPRASIYCVDTWQGGREHKSNLKHRHKIPKSLDSFLAHLWDERHRVTPVQALSWDGLAMLHAAGLRPDLVYVDASHETPDVVRDLETSLDLFPDARLFGDDWHWPSVRKAVLQVAKSRGLRLRVDSNCYELMRSPNGVSPMHFIRVRTAATASDWARALNRRLAWPMVRRIKRN